MTRKRLEQVVSRLGELGRETPEATRARQLVALRQAVEHHYQRNPTWRAMCEARGARPEHLRSLDELRAFPVVERDFLSKHAFSQGEGGVLSVPLSELTTFFNSSGSTGTPKRIPICEDELAPIAESSAMALWLAGMRGHSSPGGRTLLPMFAHGPFPGAHYTQTGCEILGFSPRADMGLPFEWHRRTLSELGVHSIVTTPSFLSALERALRAHGDPGAFGLDRIVLGGEFFGEAFREEMQRRFRCKVLDLYGCGETQIVLTESDELRERRPGFMFHLAHTSIIEIVRPGTEEPVPPGTVGEMIITVLDRRAWPVVRYRVGDLLARDPEPDRREGLSWNFPLYSRIQGRADDMLKYGNVMLFQDTFFRALATVAHDNASPVPLSLDKFRFELFDDEHDPLCASARVTIELAHDTVATFSAEQRARTSAAVIDALCAQSDELRHAIFIGRQVPAPDVVLVDAQSLYRQEQKFRRMIDRRQSGRRS